jgi:gliding motility-associated protein GldM
MAGYKETPRQKMIAMMYLVLTALLALNVSKEILDAFLVVNESIEKTNSAFKAQIDSDYAEFDNQNKMQPGKVKLFYDLALKVRAESDTFVAYIEEIKAEVISRTEKIPIEEARKINIKDVKRKNNFDVPTVYFITPKAEGGQEKAKELKARMADYRSKLISFMPDGNSSKALDARLGLKTDGTYLNRDKKKEDWELHHFYHTILAADITILNKIIAEARTSEAEAISSLFANISKKDFTFDKIDARVIATTNYVLLGAQYEADIFLAALDTKNPLKVIINGQEAIGDSGVYKLKRVATSEGPQKIDGKIILQNRQTGETNEYGFASEYIVARPAATISATKMNVFYRGLKNPLSVSVPGVANDKVRVTMTGGSLTKVAGGWEVTVTEGSEAVVTVAADIDGRVTPMGSQKFRIKKLPTPVPKVSGQNVGVISRQRLIQAGCVTAELEDFLFEGIAYTVTSFTFSTKGPDGLIKEFPIQGRCLDPASINILQRARDGQKVYFDNIKATGPDGTRNLQAIILTIR